MSKSPKLEKLLDESLDSKLTKDRKSSVANENSSKCNCNCRESFK